jgi:hypothetical protein
VSTRVPLPLEIIRQIAAEVDFPANPTPDDIKRLAAQVRRDYGVPCRKEDLLALSSSHDPFNIIEGGTREEAARWFAETVWPLVVERFVSDDEVHLRRIHYFLASIEAPDPNGETYKLTSDRSVLSKASSAARNLGLIPDVRLVDHRHLDALNHLVASRQLPEPKTEPDDADFTRLPVMRAPAPPSLAVPKVYLFGYDWDAGDEPVALYLVVEKSTVNDILVPVCRAVGISFVPLVGISSNIVIEAMVDKIAAEGRPARIGYVADVDQGGAVMPHHVARQIEHAVATGKLTVPVALQRIALTWAQVREHHLPLMDLDPDDTRNWSYEGRVELDALVALAPPGTLEGIVREWAAPYRTGAAEDELSEVRAQALRDVGASWRGHTRRLRRRLAALDRINRLILRRHEDLFDQLDGYNADVQRVLPLVERLTAEYDALADSFDPDLPGRPEPELPDDDVTDWLYDSRRGYLEQLVAYEEGRISEVHEDES